MSQNITKSIKQKEPNFPKNRPISEIPERKLKERPIKLVKAKNPGKIERTRAGNLGTINPYGKPKIIKDGKRIK